MEKTEIAGLIRKAGKRERTGEFEYPYGNIKEFYVKLAYASKFVWNQIRESAREMVRNQRTRELEERFNEDKLRHEYSTRIVQGWRGLTTVILQKLVPQMDIKVLNSPEQKVGEEIEIPFSPEIALAIMDVSIDFENWVVDIATDSANYQHVAERKKEQFENLN